ncbi:cytochrome P450 9e2-like [Periplaneta americana]|uniref:cytochrome P450 9e2-like n=1 Tax=Periplaneta americana TaxID=6978 RepID=UPI0037E8A85C
MAVTCHFTTTGESIPEALVLAADAFSLQGSQHPRFPRISRKEITFVKMTLFDWVLLLLGLGVVLYFWGTRTYRRFMKPGIPHDTPLPFIGSMGPTILKRQPLTDTILDMYKAKKGRPYSVMFMFRIPMIVIFDLELIKTITVKDFDYFPNRQMAVFENFNSLFSKALTCLKGQDWRDKRSILSPVFTSSKMKTMFVLVSECCQQFVNFLEECFQNRPNGCGIQKDGNTLILELKNFFNRYTNDVIATTAFGLGVDSLKQPKNEFFLMGQETCNFGILKVLLVMSMPKLMKFLGISILPNRICDFFSSLVKDTIATREREGIVRPDLLQLLMQAQKGNLQDENSTEQQARSGRRVLDDEDVVAQCVVFFLAGFDTASTFICFVCYHLAVDQDIQTRLQKEIDETLREGGGKFSYEALNGMKYLDMVVSETLRMHPSPGADRVCVRNYTLQADPPMELIPGDSVFIPIIGLHFDPNYFPDPDRFDPERFSDDNKHKINPLTYMPFGMGPRMCIGNRFALMETKLALTNLLSRFNIKVVPKTPIPMKIVQTGFGFGLKGGFWLGLERRS